MVGQGHSYFLPRKINIVLLRARVRYIFESRPVKGLLHLPYRYLFFKVFELGKVVSFEEIISKTIETYSVFSVLHNTRDRCVLSHTAWAIKVEFHFGDYLETSLNIFLGAIRMFYNNF